MTEPRLNYSSTNHYNINEFKNPQDAIKSVTDYLTSKAKIVANVNPFVCNYNGSTVIVKEDTEPARTIRGVDMSVPVFKITVASNKPNEDNRIFNELEKVLLQYKI